MNKNYWKDNNLVKPDSFIVCAANRVGIRGDTVFYRPTKDQENDDTITWRIVLGARHFDERMREQIAAAEGRLFWNPSQQGFIDQFGFFYNREEAWAIAEKNGQIKKEVSTPGTLYSESLY